MWAELSNVFLLHNSYTYKTSPIAVAWCIGSLAPLLTYSARFDHRLITNIAKPPTPCTSGAKLTESSRLGEIFRNGGGELIVDTNGASIGVPTTNNFAIERVHADSRTTEGK